MQRGIGINPATGTPWAIGQPYGSGGGVVDRLVTTPDGRVIGHPGMPRPNPNARQRPVVPGNPQPANQMPQQPAPTNFPYTPAPVIGNAAKFFPPAPPTIPASAQAPVFQQPGFQNPIVPNWNAAALPPNNAPPPPPPQQQPPPAPPQPPMAPPPKAQVGPITAMPPPAFPGFFGSLGNALSGVLGPQMRQYGNAPSLNPMFTNWMTNV